VFNVADPAVVGGAILLVALSLFGYDFDRTGRRTAEPAAVIERPARDAPTHPARDTPTP
jgi:hypothetical protein